MSFLLIILVGFTILLVFKDKNFIKNPLEFLVVGFGVGLSFFIIIFKIFV